MRFYVIDTKYLFIRIFVIVVNVIIELSDLRDIEMFITGYVKKIKRIKNA